MSHWTRSKVKIKDLQKLRSAAERMGLNVQSAEEGKTLNFKSSYAGSVNAAMIITDGSGRGQCAVVADANGEYTTIIDNWGNPIVDKVGRDCSTLCRDYAAEVVRQQALMMGGTVSMDRVLSDQSMEIHIQI